MKTAAKWAVEVAKKRAQNDLYQQLEDEPMIAHKNIYKLAKMRKDAQDKGALPFTNNTDRMLQVEGMAVQKCWEEYFKFKAYSIRESCSQPKYQPHHQ